MASLLTPIAATATSSTSWRISSKAITYQSQAGFPSHVCSSPLPTLATNSQKRAPISRVISRKQARSTYSKSLSKISMHRTTAMMTIASQYQRSLCMTPLTSTTARTSPHPSLKSDQSTKRHPRASTQ